MRRKKNGPEQSSDFGTVVINREYDELEKNGKLARVLKLRSGRLKLVSEWQAVLAEIMSCGTQIWADKFATKLLRDRKNVYQNLQHHFDVLGDRRRKLVVRLGENFRAIVDLGGSIMTPMEPPTGETSRVPPIPHEIGVGRSVNAASQFRDFVIRLLRNLPNEELCRRLDLELAVTDPPLGLPESWTTKYGVKTFTDAYMNPRSKNLVQKLITKAKQEM